MMICSAPAILLAALWPVFVEGTVLCYRPPRNGTQHHAATGFCAPSVTDLAYVHVGKTGGTTVRNALLESGVAFSEIHVSPVAATMVSRAAKWLVAVRDPIARAASAFYWRQPPRRLRRAHHVPPRRPAISDAAEIDLYRCFATFDAFARALYDDSPCGARARAVLDDPPPSCHLGLGLASYLRGALGALETREVFLARTPSLRRDVAAFGAWYDATRTFARLHHENNQAYNKTLSVEGASNLRRALAEDYALLARLEGMAVNGASEERPP